MATEFLAPSSIGVQGRDEAVHPVQANLRHEAFHALCRLRREDGQDSEILERALILLDTYSVVSKALGNSSLVKAVHVVQQMRNAGYSDEWAVTLCRALFRRKERDLRKAFRLFDQDRSGYIEAAELRQALPLMGEEVPDSRINELFQLVDKDKTGLIDFEEFSAMVSGLNSEEGEADAFAAFRASAEGTLGAVGGAVGSMASGTGAALSAVSTAWSANLPGLSPFEMRKAGAILNNMKAAGYSESMALSLCRALFCGQTEKQLQKAYKFFDADSNGRIDVSELKEAMKLMGEEVKDEEIDDLFKAVDHDGNDAISFEEFCVLVKAIKEKGDKADTSVLSAVSSTWEKLSAGFTGGYK
ncbi:unnamed protein product [Effrenium voratum]|uniref:EF-hand domain-containing protein n=1 Tax=Effrenium voratum TaxID=2562239 RepID=A0AA36MPN8_9DINO|nr:unnamed protein product [Effrenium voratum]